MSLEQSRQIGYAGRMKCSWAMRMFVVAIMVGVSFGALMHPIMAGNTDPMHAEMLCCDPIVTEQSAAPSVVALSIDVTPTPLPPFASPASISHKISALRPSLFLPKIPKQLVLTGSTIMRE